MQAATIHSSTRTKSIELRASPSGRSRSARASSRVVGGEPGRQVGRGCALHEEDRDGRQAAEEQPLGVGQRQVEVGDAPVERRARRRPGHRQRGAGQLHLVAHAQAERLVGQQLPGRGGPLAVGQVRPSQPAGLDPEHVHVDDAVEVDRGVRLQEA